MFNLTLHRVNQVCILEILHNSIWSFLLSLLVPRQVRRHPIQNYILVIVITLDSTQMGEVHSVHQTLLHPITVRVDSLQFWQLLLHLHLRRDALFDIWVTVQQDLFQSLFGDLRLLSKLVHFRGSKAVIHSGSIDVPTCWHWGLIFYILLKNLDILLLIPDQTAIAGIPHAYIEWKMTAFS